MPNPVIPWPGGKRRLIKHLYPHFPAHETYVEAFAGGAAALLMRPVPAPLEVINDINNDLVCLYRCIRFHPDIRAVFAGFDMVPLQLGYSIGGSSGRDRQFGELIIKSWDDRQAALL